MSFMAPSLRAVFLWRRHFGCIILTCPFLTTQRLLRRVTRRTIHVNCWWMLQVFSRKSIWTICTGSNTDETSAIGTFTREYGTLNDGGTAKLVGHQGATFTLHARTRWAETIEHWLANLFHETEYDMLQQGKIIGQVRTNSLSACSLTCTGSSATNHVLPVHQMLHLSKQDHWRVLLAEGHPQW